MSYPPQSRKDFLLNRHNPAPFAGDLTYCLTVASLYFVDRTTYIDSCITAEFNDELMHEIQRFLPVSPRYADYALVLGCLDSTRRELLRRRHETTRRDSKVLMTVGLLEIFTRAYYNNVVAPYEDTKRKQNGDVYL